MKNNQTLPPSLLTYEISTSPGPLTTSTSGASISVVIKANPAVYLDEIIIAIPAGATSSVDTVFLTSPPLSNSLSANSGWEIQALKPIKSSKTSVSLQEFKLLPKSQGTDQISQDLTFKVTGTTNDSVGTASLIISEHSGNQANQYVFRKYSHDIVKQGPRPFFLNNFMAYSSKDPNIPKTTFELAEPIELSWDANGAIYTLYQGNEPKPVYSGVCSHFSVASGVQTDTTFVLKATSGNETLLQSITLQVSNPVLTPTSSTIGVAGATQSALSVKGGTTSITGNQFTVNAPADFQGALNVVGATTLASTALTDLTVSGATSFKGSLKATGIVSTVLNPRIVYLLNSGALGKPVATNFTVSSDGFFLFQMSNVGQPVGSSSQLYAQVFYPGSNTPVIFNSFCATGQTRYQTIPVSAGTNFHLLATFFHVEGSVVWLGATPPTQVATQSLENTELPQEVADFQKQIKDLQAGASKEAYARSFVEELQVQFDKELSQEATDLLITKLLNIERGS
ncbi:MAG: hypothetical protein HEP71_33035 [Roseivirga sp.]|nr:hypothetical protein [Roseivirga sp.]